MSRPQRMVGEKRAAEILEKTHWGVLSMVDAQGRPYSTAVNAVYSSEDRCLYFHCAREGMRWKCLHDNPFVRYFAVASETIDGPRITTYYESVAVDGRACFLEDENEVRRTIAFLTERLAPGEIERQPNILGACVKQVAMVRIDIESLSAKVNERQKNG